MNSSSIIFLLIFLILIPVESAFPQVSGWDVITTAPETLISCTIGKVENAKVSLVTGTDSFQVPLDLLAVMSRRTESSFWRGAGYGTLVGAATGGLIGAASYEKPNSSGLFTIDYGSGFSAGVGAALGAVAGFTVGGVIGASSGGEQRFELVETAMLDKIRLLRRLGAEIVNYSPKLDQNDQP